MPKNKGWKLTVVPPSPLLVLTPSKPWHTKSVMEQSQNMSRQSDFDRLDTTAKEITIALTRNQCRHGLSVDTQHLLLVVQGQLRYALSISFRSLTQLLKLTWTRMLISSLMKTRRTSGRCCFGSLGFNWPVPITWFSWTVTMRSKLRFFEVAKLDRWNYLTRIRFPYTIFLPKPY